MSKDIFNNIVEELRNKGVVNPHLEARIIFGYVLKKEYQYISGTENISEDEIKNIEKIVKRRINKEPLDKIIGIKSFYKYDFIVNKDVLSPRPDTEILVEEAIRIIKENNCKKMLDMGTGSGCVVLSVLGDCPNITAIGIDVSENALAVAEKNAKKLGFSEDVSFICKSWNDKSFSEQFSDMFDIIVSNPPYIALSEKQSLPEDVKNFDPEIALFGGNDGLDEYRNIAKAVKCVLKTGGYLLLEIGINQAEKVKDIFGEQGFVFQTIKKDLSGIDRCIIFKK